MPVALVLGGAECVWEDAREALTLFNPDAFFAVKDMIAQWPLRIDYGVTLHPDRTDKYLQIRKQAGLSTNFELWAHKNYDSKTKHRVTEDWAGSSGLLAVKVAMEQGFDGIVLAGVPMSKEFGHIVRRQAWIQAGIFTKGWLKHQSQLAPIVRSMSGWTLEMFGFPTDHWLKSINASWPDPNMVRELESKAGEARFNRERAEGSGVHG